MERQEFLRSLGLGLAVVCTGSCLSACGGGDDDTSKPGNNNPPGNNPPPAGSTVSINLSSLATVGSAAKSGGVLFIRVADGNAAASFVATEALCPHQGGNLNWLANNNLIQCDSHAAQYQQSGAIIRGPQGSTGDTRALKIYAVTVSSTAVTATIS